MTKEVGYASIFITSLGLIGVVFQATQHHLQWLQPSTIISSCQTIGAYLFNWFFPIQAGLWLLGLTLVALAGLSILKGTSRLRFWRQHSRHHSPKLSRVLNHLHIPAHQVFQVEDLATEAAVVGLWQPRIIISNQTVQNLTERQLAAVVLHERHHLVNRHPVLYVLATLVSQTIWFIPSLKDIAAQMKAQFEVDADRTVIQTQGTSLFLRRALAKSLLKPNLQTGGSQSVPSFSLVAIQYRVDRLTQPTNETPLHRFLSPIRASISILVIAGLLGLVLSRPTQLAAESTNSSSSHCQLFECVSVCVQEELMSRGPSWSAEPHSRPQSQPL